MSADNEKIQFAKFVIRVIRGLFFFVSHPFLYPFGTLSAFMGVLFAPRTCPLFLTVNIRGSNISGGACKCFSGFICVHLP